MGFWSDLGVLYWKLCGYFDDLKGTSLDVTASRGLDWEVSEHDVGSVMLVIIMISHNFTICSQ